MSHNISHEAVFPPAHSIRRTANISPARKARKDFYELYDTKRKSQESPEKITYACIAGAAPGSPESFQEYNQVVEKLQQELHQSKRKESELQQMLGDLKNPIGHNNTMFLDNSYFEESPTNDTVGENVKDAHIRHLQRQVTVLQASLYKSEEWSNRVASAMKERDKALDDVAHLSARIREIQDINSQLLQKVESLTTALQVAHTNLQQATEKLQQNQYNGQLVSQLKDEIQRQGYEIKNLKDNQTQLDMENSDLKDSRRESNIHSLNSLTCSQELEHLHKVVDRLKSTVLHQRSYLLQLRTTSNGSIAKSQNSSPACLMANSLLDHDHMPRRNSSSPKPRMSGLSSMSSEAAQGNQTHQSMFRHHNRASIMKSKTSKENGECQQAQHRSSSDFADDDFSGGGRTHKFHEMLKESFNMDALGSPDPLDVQTGGAIDSRYSPRMANRLSYTFPSNFSQNLGAHYGQQAQGDVPKQTMGSVGEKPLSRYDFAKSQQQKIFPNKENHIDLIDHRFGLDNISQNKPGSKSDAFGRQMRQWNLSSANNSATLPSAGNSVADLRSPVNQEQRYKSPMQDQQETRNNESNTMPHEEIRQFVFDGNALQMRQAQYENTHLHPAAPKEEQIHHPPTSYSKESNCIIKNDMMGGGKITVAEYPTNSPVSHALGRNQQALYINSLGDGEKCPAPTASTSVDPPNRCGVNEDRICPVCNNNYSHVTMEQFQTHIFECFDDDNPPETLKSHENPPITLKNHENPPKTLKSHENRDRLCPMCNAKFGPTVAQTDYEKHVHSHFGDEAPGTNFEFL